MNKIQKIFQDKKAFIAFITAGDPNLETTEKLILEMEKAGVDLIELGIPFSDPVAEGPVIEKASERALKNGVTTDRIFDMVLNVRKKTDLPLAFMTYINPVFTYGVERFLKRCAECDICCVIIPDMPFEEKEEVAELFRQYDIKLISLIAPTSKQRIQTIAKEAEGFLYCVSSMGVTGMRSEISSNVEEMIAQVKSVNNIPCAIGFGISTPQQAAAMAKIADGVIIGSAIVNIVAQHGENCIRPVTEFVQSVKEAILQV
jgi:tryptophan synthase alpha chain